MPSPVGDEQHEHFRSGKWELFQELLSESLDAGRKVVVFTQFLGMVELCKKLLSRTGVGYVSFTGASRDRGEIVRRFNEDGECRVFLGSLKAGGTGVDLTAGSVVIHYDRWWNAAREDQATDRVYRMGQNKAVSVLKLVTEGTLEEKISAIVENKRALMNDVVRVDDRARARRSPVRSSSSSSGPRRDGLSVSRQGSTSDGSSSWST